jgi:hypothetical protein
VIQQTGASSALYADTLAYDARDKVLVRNIDTMSYSPLGQLTRSRLLSFSTLPEEFATDAMGLHRWRATVYQIQNSSQKSLGTDTVYYAPGTASIAASITHKDGPQTPDTTDYGYDGLGNQSGSTTIYHLDPAPSMPPTDPTGRRNRWGYFKKVVTTYNRENRMVKSKLEKDTIYIGMDLSAPYIATETYKYDALGRRVWARSIKPSTCVTNDVGSGCHSTDTRTIWDGDELLAEERSEPTDDPTAGYYSNGTQYGTVEYSHAGIIDQPIALLAFPGAIRPTPTGAATWTRGRAWARVAA